MARHWYCWEGPDLLLAAHIQPRAHHDEIVGPHGEELKIRITAPPVDGQANSYLRKFLANLFKVSTAQVILVSGMSGRDKRLRITAPLAIPEELRPWIALP